MAMGGLFIVVHVTIGTPCLACLPGSKVARLDGVPEVVYCARHCSSGGNHEDNRERGSALPTRPP